MTVNETINPDVEDDVEEDLFAALGEVEETDTSMVEIPDEISRALDAAVRHFATRTNRKRFDVTCPDEATAKLRYRQINQYAEAHGLSTLPKRDGNVVTFRFSQKRSGTDVS